MALLFYNIWPSNRLVRSVFTHLCTQDNEGLKQGIDVQKAFKYTVVCLRGAHKPL